MHDYRTSGVGRHRPAHRVPARPKCDVSEPWLLRSLPPRAVFERYQQWQLELERQPVVFLARRLEDLLAEARAALGAYVDSDPDDRIRPERDGGCERRCPGARTRGGRRGARYVVHPFACRWRAPMRSSRRSGLKSASYARALPQRTHVANRIDVAGSGALETCPRTRDPDDRRWGTRSWAPAARPWHPRRRLLRRELPRVVVPFPRTACPRRQCSKMSLKALRFVGAAVCSSRIQRKPDRWE